MKDKFFNRIDPSSLYIPPANISDDIEDIDRSMLSDAFYEPHYAYDIFKFCKSQELKYLTQPYLHKQPNITKSMRALLVDWMVIIEESFQLNPEALYLAVKIIDQYLMINRINQDKLQLLGATSLFIASKFENNIPLDIDDLLIMCENFYDRKDIIKLELKVLKALEFRIGYPLSCRFLRHYAKCGQVPFKLLTFARYTLELSLMEYDLIGERESKIAAAALLLALRIMQPNRKSAWTLMLRFYSGYDEEELMTLVYKLNKLISQPKDGLKTIRIKYSHRIHFEVAKISSLQQEMNENKLSTDFKRF